MGEAVIKRIEGPIIISKNTRDIEMNEEVRIGDENLVGEVIRINGEESMIQVYEDTTGLLPGIKIFGTGKPLSVELGPGIISNTFDGIQRPLTVIKEKQGIFIKRGAVVSALPRDKKWKVDLKVNKGDKVFPNSIIGEVDETSLVKHRILIPPGITGKVVEVKKNSNYSVTDTICLVERTEKKKK